MSAMLRCLMVGCLTVVCGCAVQQGGRGEKSGVAAQETGMPDSPASLGNRWKEPLPPSRKRLLEGPLRFQWDVRMFPGSGCCAAGPH